MTGIVVADAGPLIHLDELGCLDLLADFTEVRVPEAVWQEVRVHRPQALTCPQVELSRCAALPSRQVDALASVFTLHAGEAQALALCLGQTDAILLTDDTAARLAAQSVSLEAHGTLGVLVRAIRRAQRTREQVLALLAAIPARSTLHIRPALLREIIDLVSAAA